MLLRARADQLCRPSPFLLRQNLHFPPCEQSLLRTMSFLINWSTSELHTQLNRTTCLGDKNCWIQQITAPTLVVTCWIQQVTTRVGAVTCWIQQRVSPKQVVGFTCVINSAIDEFTWKSPIHKRRIGSISLLGWLVGTPLHAIMLFWWQVQPRHGPIDALTHSAPSCKKNDQNLTMVVMIRAHEL